ncbi:MAG: hypothetical protein QXV24_04580 [Nitrososphaerota archaeon]
MSDKYLAGWVLLFYLFFSLCIPLVRGEDSRDLCIDMSTAYDQSFKWYNTNGSLPAYMGDHYLFSGGSTSNMYQDAISLVPIKVGKAFALSARISIHVGSESMSSRDEFAVFVTDDTKVFTGDEFGFVIRQDSASVYGYIQSPRLSEFFREFKLADVTIGREETYNLKAVYSVLDGRAIVRFFLNDVNVLVYDFPVMTDEELYLVVSSKKLSPQFIDTSRNYMKVYSACIVNLPALRLDETNQSLTQDSRDYKDELMLFTNIAILVVTFSSFIVVVRLFRMLRGLTYKSL